MSASFVGAVEHQCKGKRTYLNSHEAKLAARQAQSRGGGKMTSYRCPHCERWHNGHKPYQLKKRRNV